MSKEFISIRGARQHNLKNIDLDIPRDKLVVITGLSGSGKSSLAFDTIYAEGQRRYVESLSAYARQFLQQMEKPDVDLIEGLSPAISIEQKTVSKNPRSTVATVTEIYDYLRLLFARIGKPHCYQCGKPIFSQTPQKIVDQILELPVNTKLLLLAPLVRGRKGEYSRQLARLSKEGFVRARIDSEIYDLSEEIQLDKQKKHTIEIVVDRLVIKEAERPHRSGTSTDNTQAEDNFRRRLTDSVETALKLGEGLVQVSIVGGSTGKNKEILFSERFACIDCGVSYPELAPRMFSFNSPYGACLTCTGLGSLQDIDPELVISDPSLSIQEGVIVPWKNMERGYLFQVLQNLAQNYNFSLQTPFEKLSKAVQELLLYGSGGKRIKFVYHSDHGNHEFYHPFEGIINNLRRRFRETKSSYMQEEIMKFMSQGDCPDCQGRRLRKESLSVLVAGKNISDYASLSVKDANKVFNELEISERDMFIAQRILKEIRERLGFLSNVGLDYLTLDRASGSLSGGEGQRIRLATQIGSSLVGVLYILDEPSVGLHQRDNRRLLNTLMNLRDLGNTVLVVEHDEETIRSADHIIDLGPGAGEHGGKVVAAGNLEKILKCPESLTGGYLNGRFSIPIPEKRRLGNGKYLVLHGAKKNNLKSIKVEIPLGTFTCLTGVSGSGKSTLLFEILYPELRKSLSRRIHSWFGSPYVEKIEGLDYIDKVIDIDQSPIGRTPRSNPATYTGLFTPIRELMARTVEAKVRGYKPGRFSFNVKGGRCEECQGDGIIKIEMHFLPDIYVTCEECKGERYNRDTLEVKYKGKNISEILKMTVAEALVFFENILAIKNKLSTLHSVGLGYIQLGQPATTLSGGEAQRIKLARELSKRSTGKTLYILDEPTTGLHFADVQKLLSVLNQLVDNGNTVIIIEHNLDVIKSADYIIDLGPEGGDEGGELVACGTPEEIMKSDQSYTGMFLKKVLFLSKTKEVKTKSSV